MLLVTTSIVPATAQVATDGTLGSKKTLSGSDIKVGADLGQIRGQNLFHSFERFNVPTKGKVTFTGPGGLNNVISRVTGGEASSIDGTLASTVPGADVYLVNPSGVVFGPNAKLDVPGSFHASTADELRFQDGAAFSALDPAGSKLTVAAPQAFGFLGGKRSKIMVDRGMLEVKSGKTLSLVGGDVEIKGGNEKEVLSDFRTSGVLSASAGRVNLVAIDDRASVNIDSGFVAGKASASIALTDAALIYVRDIGAGSVHMHGGEVKIKDQSVISVRPGFSPGKSSDITLIADSLQLSSESSIDIGIGTLDHHKTVNFADGGITIIANNAEFIGGGNIVTTSSISDNAPFINVDVAETLSMNVAHISSATFASGDGGDVRIKAKSLLLQNGTILSETADIGNAGTVQVEADKLLMNPGPDGLAVIGSVSLTRLRTLEREGDAGSVSVKAGQLEITGRGSINSSAFSAGSAGIINVEAKRLIMQAKGSVPFDEFFDFRSGISSLSVFEVSSPGVISVKADQLMLLNGSEISADSIGSSAAGNVHVEAGSLLISGQGSGISSLTRKNNFGSGGVGGTVLVEAGHVSVQDGGRISSETEGRNRAGSVRIKSQRIDVENSSISTSGQGAEGGQISMIADNLVYLSSASVVSSGINPAAGASLIRLQAPTIALNNSTVTSLTGSGQPLQGSGVANVLGDVTVISTNSVVAASSSVETTGLQTDLGSGLQIPSGTFLDADRLLRESCSRQGRTARSTFIRAGGGGLPPSPDRPLASIGPEPSSLAAGVPGALVVGGAADVLPCGEPAAKPTS